MSKRLKPETVQLLQQIKRWLLRMRHPKHFDMGNYANRNECGTSLCIAGKGLLLKGYKLRIVGGRVDGFVSPNEKFTPTGSGLIGPLAAHELGLTQGQADRLFHLSCWPRGAPSYSSSPREGAARIQRFIDTNGAE